MRMEKFMLWTFFFSFYFFGVWQLCRLRACQRVDPWALTTMLHYSSISGCSSEWGETPRCGYRPFPTTEAEGTHFLSQTHIGKTRGEEEKGAEKKCWWELAPALPTNLLFHNKTPFNLLISKPNMQIVLITKFLWFENQYFRPWQFILHPKSYSSQFLSIFHKWSWL